MTKIQLAIFILANFHTFWLCVYGVSGGEILKTA